MKDLNNNIYDSNNVYDINDINNVYDICYICGETIFIKCKCGAIFCEKCCKNISKNIPKKYNGRLNKGHNKGHLKRCAFCFPQLKHYTIYKMKRDTWLYDLCSKIEPPPYLTRNTLCHIPMGWEKLFTDNKNLRKISRFIKKELKTKTIYPPIEDVFNAFIHPDKIKVIILGQDYHGEGRIPSSSVKSSILSPSSLINIFKELKSDGFIISDKNNANLQSWVDEGVFLLNTSLTVEKDKPGSHIELWSSFIRDVINFLNTREKEYIYILWGAKSYHKLIRSRYIIDSSHPSSANNGFFGSKPFSTVNKILKDIMKGEPINFNL